MQTKHFHQSINSLSELFLRMQVLFDELIDYGVLLFYFQCYKITLSTCCKDVSH